MGLETGVFYLRDSAEGEEPVDLSGLELRWRLSRPRGMLKLSVPALSLSASGMAYLGPTLGTYRRGQDPAGDPGPAGSASRGLAEGFAGTPAGPGDPAGADRQFGMGDARVQMEEQVGRDAEWGRVFLQGGIKLPTADENRGLGTGEADAWAGATWRYEGWTTNLEAYVEWIRLGDPPGVVLQDGPAGGIFVEWPGGHVGLGVGVQAAREVFEGEPPRVQAVLEAYRGKREGSWSVTATGGLTQSAPDAALSLAFRF